MASPTRRRLELAGRLTGDVEDEGIEVAGAVVGAELLLVLGADELMVGSVMEAEKVELL